MLAPWRSRMVYKYRLWRRSPESVERALDRLTDTENRRLWEFTEDAEGRGENA